MAHLDVEESLRQILAGAEAPSGERGIPEDHHDIQEIQVDGIRYMLIPCLATPSAEVTLSPREKEIVRLVARGLPNKVIASVLEISSWTVATYLRRIFAKLEVNSRAEMVARALQAGLL